MPNDSKFNYWRLLIRFLNFYTNEGISNYKYRSKYINVNVM